MKKTLISVAALLAMTCVAFAKMPSAMERETVCNGVFMNGICLQTNPCESSDAQIRSAYCNTVFNDISSVGNGASAFVRKLVGKYLDVRGISYDSNMNFIDDMGQYLLVKQDDKEVVFEFSLQTWPNTTGEYVVAAGHAFDVSCFDDDGATEPYCEISSDKTCQDIAEFVSFQARHVSGVVNGQVCEFSDEL